MTVAERAERDRTWAYGHVVVDEAQELSPMTWRLLMRRCPTRSMTLVGDIAQTGVAGRRALVGARCSSRYVEDRWRLEELTVNYRTPAQIMELASDSAGRGRHPGDRPRVGARRRLAAGALRVEPRRRRTLSPRRRARARSGQRRTAGRGDRAGGAARTPVRAALAAALRGTVAEGAATPGQPGRRCSPWPASRAWSSTRSCWSSRPRSCAESPRGANDLYVAMTRPTQRLLVLHSDPLPPGLTGLATA